MESPALFAVKVFFVLWAVTPLVLVVHYRWRDVRWRKADIAKAMAGAFGPGKADQQALRNNPYMSNPNETFDRFHQPVRYLLPLLFLTVLTASASSVAYVWVEARLLRAPAATSAPAVANSPVTAAPGADAPAGGGAATASLPPARWPDRVPLVIIMAIAGGMVWSLQQLISRIYDGELGPPDLYEVGLGLFAAVPIGYAFSLVTAELNGVRSFMAFAASAFPVREASRIVRQYATRRMLESTGSTAARPAERHLGTAIDGVSDAALARLAELRIVTALDMAYSDPMKVMVQTGFALPVIIDWMDQAIWALYVGDRKADLNQQGIRCSLDVCEFVDLHLRDPLTGKVRPLAELGPVDKDAVKAVADKLGTTPELLRDMFLRIRNDPQVVVLRELWYQGGVPRELRAGSE